MAKLYIGIDPGVTGSIAAICGNDGNLVDDMPTLTAPNASRKETYINAVSVKVLIETIMGDHNMKVDDTLIVLEKTQPMKDSAMTAFSMGMSRGILIAVASIIGIPKIDVMPQVWKKHFGLIKCDKDASRTLALDRFPWLSDSLKRKKDHNRAEALLLALYGKEKSF